MSAVSGVPGFDPTLRRISEASEGARDSLLAAATKPPAQAAEAAALLPLTMHGVGSGSTADTALKANHAARMARRKEKQHSFRSQAPMIRTTASGVDISPTLTAVKPPVRLAPLSVAPGGVLSRHGSGAAGASPIGPFPAAPLPLSPLAAFSPSGSTASTHANKQTKEHSTSSRAAAASTPVLAAAAPHVPGLALGAMMAPSLRPKTSPQHSSQHKSEVTKKAFSKIDFRGTEGGGCSCFGSSSSKYKTAIDPKKFVQDETNIDIKELIIEHCDINAESLRELEYLPKLTRLTIRDCAQLTDSCFQNREVLLRRLKHLDISGTAITDKTLVLINKNCRDNLTSFSIAGTAITRLDLARTRNLLTLDISECPNVSDEHLGLIAEKNDGLLRNLLTEFNLSGCPVSDEGIRHIATIRSLRTLQMKRCRITDEGVKLLAQVPPRLAVQPYLIAAAGLTAEDIAARQEGEKPVRIYSLLDLSDTNITNKSLEHLKGVNALEHLCITGCNKVTNEGLENVKDIKGLKRLTAESLTSITYVGIQKVLADNPTLLVNFDQAARLSSANADLVEKESAKRMKAQREQLEKAKLDGITTARQRPGTAALLNPTRAARRATGSKKDDGHTSRETSRVTPKAAETPPAAAGMTALAAAMAGLHVVDVGDVKDESSE